MSSWLEHTIAWASSIKSSQKAQLILTAILSGVLVGSGVLGFQAANKRARTARLKWSIHPEKDDHDSIADQISEYKAHAAEKQDKRRDPAIPHIDLDQETRPAHHSATVQDEEEGRIAKLAARARTGHYDEELILEQLARNRVFLTDEGLTKLRSSFIIVVGLGGVGSHATAALARSGVSKIRLIDFDQVTLSSLNRHAVATLADVGTPKVICLQKRLEQVTPWVHFDSRNELFSASMAERQLGPWGENGQQADFVIDAIDNIDSKVELLKYCHDQKLKVISSMGAGCKSDPTRIFIGDISSSTEDPLSRSTRRRLKILGVSSGIPVVFSTEKAAPGKAQLLPLPQEEFEKGKVGELGVLPDFRVRILPVLGTMPAVFGLCVANHVMLEITGYPHDYIQAKARDKMYDGIFANLQGSEERLARASGDDAIGLRLPITVEDVGYLVEEVYRGRSVVSNLSTRLSLVRWRRIGDTPSIVDKDYTNQKYTKFSLNKLVCMTKEEAAKHEKEVLRGGKLPEDLYTQDVLDLVEKRIHEEATYAPFR